MSEQMEAKGKPRTQAKAETIPLCLRHMQEFSAMEEARYLVTFLRTEALGMMQVRTNHE